MTAPRSTLDTALLVVVVLNLLCAPWSWIDDGVTPSWVVYPLVLLVALYRLRRQDRGRLMVAIAASVFLVVHIPWVVAAVSGDENPLDPDGPFNPGQWLVTLLVAPLAAAAVAWPAWRQHRGRHLGDGTPTTA